MQTDQNSEVLGSWDWDEGHFKVIDSRQVTLLEALCDFSTISSYLMNLYVWHFCKSDF